MFSRLFGCLSDIYISKRVYRFRDFAAYRESVSYPAHSEVFYSILKPATHYSETYHFLRTSYFPPTSHVLATSHFLPISRSLHSIPTSPVAFPPNRFPMFPPSAPCVGGLQRFLLLVVWCGYCVPVYEKGFRRTESGAGRYYYSYATR